jgi:SAM-dependent methyltransferase
VIANHVLEHCRDPIRALQSMLRVTAADGVLFLAIPDKRYTFDRKRAVTPYEHLVRDYFEGAAVSESQHYAEWRRDVLGLPEGDSASVDELRAAHPDIHFHVWTQREIAELLLNVQRDFAMRFEIELLAKNGSEVVAVLRKQKAEAEESRPT